jgi:hypothetical protein
MLRAKEAAMAGALTASVPSGRFRSRPLPR